MLFTEVLMKNKPINNEFSIRTDLVIEAREILNDTSGSPDTDGVTVDTQSFYNDDITVTWVSVQNEAGAKIIGKPVGNYVTVESDLLKANDIEAHEEIIKIVSEKLGKLHNLKKDATILVVGLGNWNVTPDALGPKVIAKVLVTNHIKDSIPEDLQGRVRTVSAISPGVMGLTGLETGDVVKGIADRIKPDLIIAIDALAARRTSRINATIQMSDTGVNPGAGVGNKRMSLNEETLGVPVIAIGVPTVVDAATLVNDTMDKMLKSMIEEAPKGTEFYTMLHDLESDEKYGLIKDILNPYTGNMFVTPKEVDAVIDRLSNIIANSVNISLHPGIDRDDINRYLY